jgi:hypothetical protein
MARAVKKVIPKVISAKTHSVIDYIHAGTNFAAGAMFRQTNRRASNAALALGAGVLANALMTDYPLGVFRLYSFRVHGILDYGVAAVSGALPALLRIQDTREAKYFTRQGAGETVIAGMTDYQDDSGSRRKHRGGWLLEAGGRARKRAA